MFQAEGTASAKACGQRQLEHLRPAREGSGGGDGVLPLGLQSHPERAGSASPCRVWGPKDTHLKGRPTLPSPTPPSVPCGPDPQSPPNSEFRALRKQAPYLNVWLQPFCWEVGEGGRGAEASVGRKGWTAAAMVALGGAGRRGQTAGSPSTSQPWQSHRMAFCLQALKPSYPQPPC